MLVLTVNLHLSLKVDNSNHIEISVCTYILIYKANNENEIYNI